MYSNIIFINNQIFVLDATVSCVSCIFGVKCPNSCIILFNQTFIVDVDKIASKYKVFPAAAPGTWDSDPGAVPRIQEEYNNTIQEARTGILNTIPVIGWYIRHKLNNTWGTRRKNINWHTFNVQSINTFKKLHIYSTWIFM